MEQTVHRIIQAQANPDFSVDLRFEDGQQARVDLSKVVHSAAIAAPFRDPARFVRDSPELPDLTDPTVRARLTPTAVGAAIRLAEIWQLSNAEIRALLGDVFERTWFRMKKGAWPGTLSQDTLTRISALLGIFKGLRQLFSEPLCDEWVLLPNKGPLYGGWRPLDAMIAGGIPKMLEVRCHIDALCGGLQKMSLPPTVELAQRDTMRLIKANSRSRAASSVSAGLSRPPPSG